MKKTLIALSKATALTLVAGLFVGIANGQGSGGGRTGSTGGTGGTGGGSSTGSSSSLFNSGSSGSSSSSLFSSGSSSTSSTSSGGSSGGTSDSGGTGNTQTSIDTGTFGGATPLTRGTPLERSSTGSNLISSNPDVIGGQSTGNNNQFANLFSQIGRSINQGGNFNQQGGRNAARSTIRIPLRLGFAPKPISVPQFTAKFEGRIANLHGLSTIGPIRVTMDGSTAVLTGVVASEQDRQMAEGVALLEPEVETVRNELKVQPGAEGLNSPSNNP